MKGKIAAACSAVAMTVFGSVALAAPAHAAQWVKACFTFSDGNPWGGLPTQLHVYDGGVWVAASETRTDSYGCAEYDLFGHYIERLSHVVAYAAISDGVGGVAYEWYGISEDAPAEHRRSYLGTYVVTCTPGTTACPVF